jgi:hypothetical protein
LEGRNISSTERPSFDEKQDYSRVRLSCDERQNDSPERPSHDEKKKYSPERATFDEKQNYSPKILPLDSPKSPSYYEGQDCLSVEPSPDERDNYSPESPPSLNEGQNNSPERPSLDEKQNYSLVRSSFEDSPVINSFDESQNYSPERLSSKEKQYEPPEILSIAERVLKEYGINDEDEASQAISHAFKPSTPPNKNSSEELSILTSNPTVDMKQNDPSERPSLDDRLEIELGTSVAVEATPKITDTAKAPSIIQGYSNYETMKYNMHHDIIVLYI